MRLVAHVRYGIEPSRSSLWRNNVLAGTIDWRRIRQAERLIQTQPPGNGSMTCHCRMWVLIRWRRSDERACYEWMWA